VVASGWDAEGEEAAVPPHGGVEGFHLHSEAVALDLGLLGAGEQAAGALALRGDALRQGLNLLICVGQARGEVHAGLQA
jgi:hypothetical protein